MKDNIPTTTIKLPVSGKEVVVYNYLTTGENRQVQKAMVRGTKVNPESGRVDDIDGAVLFDVQDLAMSFLIKDFNKEEIDSLVIEDGDFLYAKVQEITTNSSLTLDSKKK